MEYSERFLEKWDFRTGARVDYVQTDIGEALDQLDNLGLGTFSRYLSRACRHTEFTNRSRDVESVRIAGPAGTATR